MPFKNEEKKKEYYHRHKKGYDKTWRKQSSRWNEYQKNYRLEKRKSQVERIKNNAIQLNISTEGDATFISWCILVFMAESGNTREWAIAKRLGYDFKTEVKPIFVNLRENDIWDGKRLNIDIGEDENKNFFEILLCAMAGAGLVKREKI